MSQEPSERARRELEEVARALDRAARLEREAIRASEGASTADELRAVEAALERVRGSQGGASGRRTWLIAAGLLVGALLLWRFLPRDEPRARPGRVPLGEGRVEILEPVGGVPSFQRVRWRTGSQGRPRYRVLVLDEASGQELLDQTDLQAFELPLDNRDTHAWQRIRIEVYEIDASGQEGRVAVARAWRSP